MSSTHARSHIRPSRPTPTAPWIVVATLIAGAVLLGCALIAGSVALLVIGAVLVAAGGVCAIVLNRRGEAPLSFTDEFPEHTYGPRATTHGDSTPPIDTRPNRPPEPAPYQTMEEVDAGQMRKSPDNRRAFPQYENLNPDESQERIDPRRDDGR